MAKPNHIKVGTSEFARFNYTLYLNTKPAENQTVSCHNNVPSYFPGQVVSGYCELKVEEISFIRGIWIKIQGEENIFYKQMQYNQYVKSCPPEEVRALHSSLPSSQSFEMKFDIFEQYSNKLKRLINIAEHRLSKETSNDPNGHSVRRRDVSSLVTNRSEEESDEEETVNSLTVRRYRGSSAGNRTRTTTDEDQIDSDISRAPSSEEESVESSEKRQGGIDALKEQLTKCRKTLQSIEVHFSYWIMFNICGFFTYLFMYVGRILAKRLATGAFRTRRRSRTRGVRRASYGGSWYLHIPFSLRATEQLQVRCAQD